MQARGSVLVARGSDLFEEEGDRRNGLAKRDDERDQQHDEHEPRSTARGWCGQCRDVASRAAQEPPAK